MPCRHQAGGPLPLAVLDFHVTMYADGRVHVITDHWIEAGGEPEGYTSECRELGPFSARDELLELLQHSGVAWCDDHAVLLPG